LETVATIALMCEPRDIGRALGDKAPDGVASTAARVGPGEFDPTLFLFDHVPGGIGLAERIFELGLDLLARSRAMVAACACEQGCPACVGPEAPNATPDRMTRKRAALVLLSAVLGG